MLSNPSAAVSFVVNLFMLKITASGRLGMKGISSLEKRSVNAPTRRVFFIPRVSQKGPTIITRNDQII